MKPNSRKLAANFSIWLLGWRRVSRPSGFNSSMGTKTGVRLCRSGYPFVCDLLRIMLLLKLDDRQLRAGSESMRNQEDVSPQPRLALAQRAELARRSWHPPSTGVS